MSKDSMVPPRLQLGEGVFVGLGAKLIPGVVVEDWAWTGIEWVANVCE
jgi:acetyltransferase-like isoleucine patch superfamily enzyme